ncbi:MAG: UvrD-helicase domain-containing protein [Spirochaetia bacterium]|nr:UvrD-helicase domain-containing protein [Spirochaetia bacterium]
MIDKIINASAGTGKTHTILEMALEGAQTPDEVRARLASTVFLSFSTSAVEEIKERLYEKTQNGKEGKSSLSDALNSIPEFRAYTIHGFAVELAKMMRYELGMPESMEFVPVEDYTVWDGVVEGYFSREWDRENIKHRLGLSGTDALMADALFLLSDHYSLKRFIKEKGDALYYLLGLGDTDAGGADGKKAAQLLAKLGITGTAGAEDALFALKKELAVFSSFVEENAKDIMDLRDKIPGMKKAPDIKRNQEQLDALLAEYREKRDAAQATDVMRLLDGCSGILARIISDIGDNFYLPVLLKDGVFDFDAIVYMVVKLVKQKGRKWFLKRLEEEGFGFDRIYIDEAQDSDIVQNYLVTILAGGDGEQPVSVVVVGDTKQSIYQWRSAYPEEFRAFYNSAKERKDKKRYDDLKTTWRIENQSTLEYLNNLFLNMSAQSTGLWDYDKDRDELALNKDRTKEAPPNVKAIRLFKNTDLADFKDELQAYVTGADVGILGRSRSKIKRSGLTAMLQADFKYRTRLDRGDDDLEKLEINDTFYPEYFLIRSLLYTQVSGLNTVVPQMLLFTPPGKAAMAGMNIKEKDRFPDNLKEPHRHVTDLYRLFFTSKASKTVYTMLERYNLWEMMWHGTEDGPSQDLSPQVLSRNINSLLTVIHLYELKMSSAAFSVEDLIEGLKEASMVPYEWYALPGKGKKGTVEISSVHASKGLQYDRVIFMDDMDAALNPEPRLNRGDYDSLYNVEFEDMLGAPKIKADFFPYLGKTPARMIRYLGEQDASMWKGAVKMFAGVNRRVVSEQFNLLYVALTRTRDGLVIIDMPAAAKYAPGKSTGGKLGELSEPGFEPVQAAHERPELEEPNQKEIYYLKLKEVKKPFPPLQGAGSMTVRDYVTMGTGLKFKGPKKHKASDTALNMETGTEAHLLLEKIMRGIRDIKDFPAELAKYKPGPGAGKAQERAFAILSSKGAAESLSAIAEQVKSGIRPEVAVWGIKDGVLVKGVMDGISVSGNKCTIVEYKTVFGGDGDFQERFGEEQVKVYEEFVKEIFAGKAVNGKVVKVEG